MKKNLLIKSSSILVLSFLVLFGCTKDIEDVRLDPTVQTAEVLELTSSTAKVVGFVVAQGSGFTERGVVYHTAPNPTVENSKVVFQGTTESAAFNVMLTGLSRVTKYYARAYAISAAGVVYGKQFDFTTLAVLPTVTTTAVSAITGTTAQTGGNVTDNGGAVVTERGVVYATTPNPTVANNKIVSGDGSGAFTSALSGLQGLTTYYVRAYAINSVGTVYGEQRQFTTLVSIRTWYLAGNFLVASYPDHTYLNWDPAQSPFVRNAEGDPDNMEGYFYMALANNEFKVVRQPSWSGDYGSGGPGILAEGGGNIQLAGPHFYKLNINPTALTYTAQPLIWGVIGEGTPGGWVSETPLTYKPAQRVWSGGLVLTGSPSVKFRAHDWAWNYGGTGGNLVHGGPNIDLVAGHYFFILDLSTPHQYKYSANRWSIIGSVNGAWNNDSFLTWSAVDQAMVLTANLTAGEFKFRANADWGVNLGGTPSNLTFGGGNITVAEAGNYTIKLFPRADGGTYTIVKN
jgi:hypothetical protein